MNIIGKNIRSLRDSRGMTQQQLADVVGAKTYTTITKWEKGDNVPQGKDLVVLSNYFNVSVDSILGLNNQSLNIEISNYTYYPTAISAGLPIEINGTTETEQISLPDSLMGKHAGDKDIFIGKISGDSMNKLIPDESLIAVKPTTLHNLKNGDIVVYSDNFEYSVKQYYKQDDEIIFRPYSNDFSFRDDIYKLDNVDDLLIHGKVVLYTVELD